MATGRVPTTANSPLTAKGDLFTYDTSQARLAVGNNGETLVADSSATTGLRWTSTPSASNPILNSAFDIWQRGTSFSVAASTTNSYVADRWALTTNANQATTVSRQTTSDTTNLPAIQYALRFQRNSGQTGTGTYYLAQSLESANSIPFAGKTVTLSYYARAGANYSATSSALGAAVYTGTGTDQSVLGAYTGGAVAISGTATLTTTWQRFSITGSIGSTATEFGVYWTFTPTGTASTNDWFEITGVQLDVGSVALPFRRSSATLAGELAACQRYYAKSYAQATAPATNSAAGYITLKVASNTIATAEGYGTVFLPVTMRTAPSVTIRPYTTASNTGRVSSATGTDLAANSGNAVAINETKFSVNNNTGGTLTTAELVVIFHYEASAEL